MKMPENVEAIMFAPCGMNCLVCYKHCYHKKPCDGCVSNAAPIPVNVSIILRKATINVIKPALLKTAGWLKIRV